MTGRLRGSLKIRLCGGFLLCLRVGQAAVRGLLNKEKNMAKYKLDWFKLDCRLDSKMELIEAEYGLLGFAVVVKLWQEIYGSEGYYCEWNDDIAILFSKKHNIALSKVKAVLMRAIARGIFHKGLFEQYGILTSHGIQVRYYDAVDRRKFAKIKPEYLLLCDTQFEEDADNSGENADISTEKANIFFTEKKREEKKRTDEKREAPQSAPAEISKVGLTDEEYRELVRLSDEITVRIYINKLIAWQQQNSKRSVKAYITVKNWIEQDKQSAKRTQPTPAPEASKSSFDLAAWQEYAEHLFD